MVWSIRHLLNAIINIFLGGLAFFLLARIAFRFFSVNPSTPFVSWVYGISGSLITPFKNILPNLHLATGFIDFTAIFSLVFYLILGYLLTVLIDGLIPQREDEIHTHHYIRHV